MKRVGIEKSKGRREPRWPEARPLDSRDVDVLQARAVERARRWDVTTGSDQLSAEEWLCNRSGSRWGVPCEPAPQHLNASGPVNGQPSLVRFGGRPAVRTIISVGWTRD